MMEDRNEKMRVCSVLHIFFPLEVSSIVLKQADDDDDSQVSLWGLPSSF